MVISSPSSFFFFLPFSFFVVFFSFQTRPHTCTERVWQQLTQSGTEVVPFWLEFGTTVSLIRVEMDHMAGWEAGGSPAERLVLWRDPINNQEKRTGPRARCSSRTYTVAARSFVCRQLSHNKKKKEKSSHL